MGKFYEGRLFYLFRFGNNIRWKDATRSELHAEDGKRFNQRVRHQLWDKNKNKGLILYKSYCTLIITHGAEAWTLNDKEWRRVQAGEMKSLRKVERTELGMKM